MHVFIKKKGIIRFTFAMMSTPKKKVGLKRFNTSSPNHLSSKQPCTSKDVNLAELPTSPQKDKSNLKMDSSKVFDEDNESTSDDIPEEEMHGFNIDNTLEEKLKKHGLNRRNVKTIIHELLNNENVRGLLKANLDDAASCSASLPEFKHLRSKSKRSVHEKAKKFTEIPLPEDDEDDEEYRPNVLDISQDTDASQETLGSIYDLDTSLSASQKNEALMSEEDRCADDLFLKDLNECDKEFKAMNEKSKQDEIIAQRTRSKHSLLDIAMAEIETAFIPPDVTEDMYKPSGDDEWHKWLAELMMDDTFLKQTDAAEDDNEQDPDYNFIQSDAEEVNEKEDFRNDPGTHIPRKEVQELLQSRNSSSLDFMGQSMMTSKVKESNNNVAYKRNISFPIETINLSVKEQLNSYKRLKANSNVTPRPRDVTSRPRDSEPSLRFSEAQIETLQLQLRQHTQLLTQLNLTCRNIPAHSSLVHDSHALLKELQQFGDYDRTNFNISASYFDLPCLTDALSIVQRGIETSDPVTRLEKNHHNLSPIQRNIANIMATESMFAFPKLLPTGSPPPTLHEHTRLSFTPSEDKLLVLGLAQMQGLLVPWQILIHEYMMPSKQPEQIRTRVANCGTRSEPSNPIRLFKQRGILPGTPPVQRPRVGIGTDVENLLHLRENELPDWLIGLQQESAISLATSSNKTSNVDVEPSHITSAPSLNTISVLSDSNIRNIQQDIIPTANKQQSSITLMSPQNHISILLPAIISTPAQHVVCIGQQPSSTTVNTQREIACSMPKPVRKPGIDASTLKILSPLKNKKRKKIQSSGKLKGRPKKVKSKDIEPPGMDVLTSEVSRSTPANSEPTITTSSSQHLTTSSSQHLTTSSSQHLTTSSSQHLTTSSSQHLTASSSQQPVKTSSSSTVPLTCSNPSKEQNQNVFSPFESSVTSHPTSHLQSSSLNSGSTLPSVASEPLTNTLQASIVTSSANTAKQNYHLSTDESNCKRSLLDSNHQPPSLTSKDEHCLNGEDADDDLEEENQMTEDDFEEDMEDNLNDGADDLSEEDVIEVNKKSPAGKRKKELKVKWKNRKESSSKKLGGRLHRLHPGLMGKRKSRTSEDHLSRSLRESAKKVKMLEEETIVQLDPTRGEKEMLFAQGYLKRIEESLSDQPRLLVKVLETMCEFNADTSQPPHVLFNKLAKLLAPWPDLIQGFAPFLMPEQANICGLLEEQQVYARARKFLRQLEIRFSDNHQHLSRILNAFRTVAESGIYNEIEMKNTMLSLLKSDPYLQEEFLMFFDDERPPESRLHGDFEDIVWSDDLIKESNLDSFEHVRIPSVGEHDNPASNTNEEPIESISRSPPSGVPMKSDDQAHQNYADLEDEDEAAEEEEEKSTANALWETRQASDTDEDIADGENACSSKSPHALPPDIGLISEDALSCSPFKRHLPSSSVPNRPCTPTGSAASLSDAISLPPHPPASDASSSVGSLLPVTPSGSKSSDEFPPPKQDENKQNDLKGEAPRSWSRDDDTLLLSVCKEHGPSDETFVKVGNELGRSPRDASRRFEHLMSLLAGSKNDTDTASSYSDSGSDDSGEI